MALDLFILADCGTADRVAANLTLLKWPGIVKLSRTIVRKIIEGRDVYAELPTGFGPNFAWRL